MSSLYRYFKPVRKFPYPNGDLSAIIPPSAIREANKEVAMAAVTEGITEGRKRKPFKPHATTRVRSNFFATRSVDAWNRLPEYIIEAQSTYSFKNLFDIYYSNQMFVLDS